MSKPVEKIREIVKNHKKLYRRTFTPTEARTEGAKWVCRVEPNIIAEYFHVVNSDQDIDIGNTIKLVLKINNVSREKQKEIIVNMEQMLEGKRTPKYICITHDYKVYSTEFLRE